MVKLNGANDYLDINADKVCVYGRNGVRVAEDYGNPDRGITARKIFLVSEEAEAGPRNGFSLSADEIYIRAKRAAWIGQNDVVNVTGPITIISNGTYADSDASIKANTVVTAGSITITTAKQAYLGDNTVVTTTGPVNLTSTGSYTNSDAMLNAGCQLTASDLRIEASKSAFVGENAVVHVTNAAAIVSRDAATGSQAILKAGGSISGASLNMTSGNKATLGVSSSVNVSGNFNMSGVNCSIASSAMIAAGSTTGTCFGHGPVSSADEDHTPPTSYISSSVPLDPDGKTEVPETALFEIGATDTASGVKSLFYSIDEDNPVEYIGPFDLVNSPEGIHTICFFSRDEDGNEEERRCIVIRLKRQTPLPTVGH